MTPPPRHPAARSPHRRVLVLAASAVALVAAGSIPAALASQGAVTGPNLALSRPATGSAPCRADEAAAKAVDGITSGLHAKWCTAAAAKSLVVDLGSATALTSVVVRHAGSAGENAALNTRDFDVEVSSDGTTFSTAARIRSNTASVTTQPVAATGRYVRLTVLRPEQAATGGVARIYELEAYGSPSAPSPSPSTSPSVPGSCFPYPERDATQDPHPRIVVNPGVPALDKKYLDPATTIWVNQWAGAWQRFATPDDLKHPDQGIGTMILTTDAHARFGDGTIEIPYKDWLDAVDRQDSGMWMHESAHLLQTGYPYPDVVKFYGEGIPDFVRFVAHGEDPAWKIAGLSATDSGFFDEQKAWDSGYREAARFLLWVTQHYDHSGAKYQLVHDLNLGVSVDHPDWQGVFAQVTGKSYHQLFTEYTADRTINPHC